MNCKKISVIIPTYKPGKYLYECLDSLKNQTIQIENYEVIIVLNGEKDPYYTEIENYTRKKQNFRLIYTEKIGVSNARNVGIKESQYDYILFLDDDDYLSKKYLEHAVKIAGPKKLVVTNLLCFEEVSNVIVSDYVSNHFEKFYLQNDNYKVMSDLFKMRKFFSNACGKLIYKQDIEKILFDVDFSKGEDSLFMSMMSKNIKVIVFTDKEAIYFRRIRNGSASRLKEPMSKNLKNRKLLIVKYIQIIINQKKNYLFHLSRIAAQIIGGFKEVLK